MALRRAPTPAPAESEGHVSIKAIRGMKDVMGTEVARWRLIEAVARKVFRAFGFSELRTPILEKTELFARSIGQATDIVEKEMYTFRDRSGDSLTLRPEATASVVRSYLEHKIHRRPGPHKFFTIGPMFRHERPQKGRLRQFHQLDAEVLGDPGPQVDAELMVMLTQLLQALELDNVELVINSLGCPVCRPDYRRALVGFFQDRTDQLCDDCRRRLEVNPLRVLDCKSEGCRAAAADAPATIDYLCADCADHYQEVKRLLELSSVAFREDPRLVRGLDYYVRTTFEAIAGDLGAQNAVAGGGRYDPLVAELGGEANGAIGFAAGIERLSLVMGAEPPTDRPELFVAALGDQARDWVFPLVAELRSAGLWVEMTSQDKSLKAQMRRANKLAADAVLILGRSELDAGRAIIKQMADGSQQEIELSQLGRAVRLLKRD